MDRLHEQFMKWDSEYKRTTNYLKAAIVIIHLTLQDGRSVFVQRLSVDEKGASEASLPISYSLLPSVQLGNFMYLETEYSRLIPLRLESYCGGVD